MAKTKNKKAQIAALEKGITKKEKQIKLFSKVLKEVRKFKVKKKTEINIEALNDISDKLSQ